MSPKKPVAAVVGTGLIGCSIALALKKSGYCGKVLGLSRTAETLEQAVRCGAVDGRLDGVETAAHAGTIILCAPVSAIVSHIRELGAVLTTENAEHAEENKESSFQYRKHHAGRRGESLIIDTGSTKVSVVKAALEAGLGPVFVGGHPMAGSEKSGPAAARADLFKDKTFFLTVSPETTPETLQAAREFVNALGAVAIEIDAQEHDRAVALTSHLPYLLAAALSSLTGEQSDNLDHVRDAFGGVFKDMTRVAEGSPKMWADILSDNSDNVKEWLQKLIDKAQNLIAAADDPEKLKQILHALRESHRKLVD